MQAIEQYKPKMPLPPCELKGARAVAVKRLVRQRPARLVEAVDAFLLNHPKPTEDDLWKLAGDLKRFGYYSITTAKSDIVLTILGMIYPNTDRCFRKCNTHN